MGNDIHALGQQSVLVDTASYQEIKLKETINQLKDKWSLFRTNDFTEPESPEISTKIELTK